MDTYRKSAFTLIGALVVASLTGTALISSAQAAPALVEPTACDASGFSIDQDRGGLNVRDSPSTTGKIVGKLYSVTDPEFAGELFGPRFAIRDVKAGWVLIANADPTSEEVGGETKNNYTGVGWVSAKKIRGVLYAQDLASPLAKSYSRAGTDSKVVDADGLTNAGNMKDEFGSYPRVDACSGEWLQVTYRQSGFLNSNKKWVKYTAAQRKKRPPITAWLHSIPKGNA
jgi:hypothetical protein